MPWPVWNEFCGRALHWPQSQRAASFLKHVDEDDLIKMEGFRLAIYGTVLPSASEVTAAVRAH